MIKIKSLNKYFNKSKANQIHVINNTSFELPEKGFVSILGPSGCGKTTLLNSIGGLDSVNGGQIYINNQKITGRSSNKIDEIRNANIGYIFQNYHLIDGLSVRENVEMSLKMLGYKPNEMVDIVKYTLEAVGMYRYRNRPVEALSGGQRQRVGIARALVKDPKIIIADEPTGNLDSRNSLEIVSILKKISKKRLVILVTHEDDLARFFSDRIIELIDGKVVKDYENTEEHQLDYRLESKIYLKDLDNNKLFENKNIIVDYYGDNKTPVKITLAVKNGNLFIETNLNVLPVQQNSIELVNDHYKSIKKDEMDDNEFDLSSFKVNHPLKYTSIFKIRNLVSNGLNSLRRYTKLKKFLYVGFILASMFILYSVSNICGLKQVDPQDYVNTHPNNVIVNWKAMDQKTFYNWEKNLKSISAKYIVPSNTIIGMNIIFDKYYQTLGNTLYISGGLTSSNYLNETDLLYGKLPTNDNELVLDVWTLDTDGLNKAGYMDIKECVGLSTTIANEEYVICGIVSLQSPCIYCLQDNIFDIIIANHKNYMYELNMIVDYKTYENDYKVVKGSSLPIFDFECSIPEYLKDQYKLGSTYKYNNCEYKVVGYYESESLDYGTILVNTETYHLSCLNSFDAVTVSSYDSANTIEYFKSLSIEAYNQYQVDYENYMTSHNEEIKDSITLALIFFIISLIEIYLMERSSFLSRIKEVGTLRAIGLKKKEIYKMFISEIVVLTFITSSIGVGFMGYILLNLTKAAIFRKMYMINIPIVLVTLGIIYLFNIFVGLLPVFATMRKTPAAILKRTDVD